MWTIRNSGIDCFSVRFRVVWSLQHCRIGWFNFLYSSHIYYGFGDIIDWMADSKLFLYFFLFSLRSFWLAGERIKYAGACSISDVCATTTKHNGKILQNLCEKIFERSQRYFRISRLTKTTKTYFIAMHDETRSKYSAEFMWPRRL